MTLILLLILIITIPLAMIMLIILTIVINDNSMTLLPITILISHDQTHDNKIIRMIIRMIRTTNNHGLMVMMTMMNVYSTHSCTFNAW